MAGQMPGGGGLPSQNPPAQQDPMMASEGPVTQADITDLRKAKGRPAGPIFQGPDQGARAQALKQMLMGGGGGAPTMGGPDGGGQVTQNQRRRV